MRLLVKFIFYALSIATIGSIMLLRTPAVSADTIPVMGSLLTVPLTPQDKIAYWSEVYGVDARLATCIARRESGFNPRARNRSSTAVGAFQLIEATWREASTAMDVNYTLDDRLNEDKNIQVALWLMGRGEYRRWVTYPVCAKTFSVTIN